MAGFVDNLAAVNAIAERSEGFVWRYTDESGNATSTRPYDGDPMMAVNMSVWENVESLEKYVWQTVHKRFYAERHEWFDTMGERYLVMWWVPAGHRPTVHEAIERLEHLKANGPSDHAFAWRVWLRLNSGRPRGAHEHDHTQPVLAHADAAGAPRHCGHVTVAAALLIWMAVR